MSRTTTRSALFAVLAALIATALIAVTANPAGAKVRSAAAKVQVLHLSVKPGMLMFNTKALHAHPGTIKIVLDNPKNGGAPHGIAVQGHGVDRDSKVVTPGHDAIVTVKLTKKGSYTFYCPVPGHEMAGMKGTLTIS